MIVHRPAAERGKLSSGWLDSRHTFSFGHYHDSRWMGFGPLRVINQDRVAPGAGFPPHGHANMEILSIVLEGALAHRDSSGGEGVIRPGDVQCMSAGHGVEHSEYNASATEPVHFLQVWIQPDRLNAAPGYAQTHVADAERIDRLRVVASPDGADGSLRLRQNACVYVSRLHAGAALQHPLAAGRRAWLQLLAGTLTVAEQPLLAGDGAGVSAVGTLSIVASTDSAFVLFDVP